MLAYMISVAIILFGVIGLRGIGVDKMPNVEPPVITVTTVNAGASIGTYVFSFATADVMARNIR